MSIQDELLEGLNEDVEIAAEEAGWSDWLESADFSQTEVDGMRRDAR